MNPNYEIDSIGLPMGFLHQTGRYILTKQEHVWDTLWGKDERQFERGRKLFTTKKMRGLSESPLCLIKGGCNRHCLCPCYKRVRQRGPMYPMECLHTEGMGRTMRGIELGY